MQCMVLLVQISKNRADVKVKLLMLYLEDTNPWKWGEERKRSEPKEPMKSIKD